MLGDKKLEFQDFPDISNYINILYKILKNDSHAYIMCNHKQLPIFFNAIENSDFNFCQLLTWEKTNNQLLTNYYLLKNEFIFLLSKGYKEINNKKFIGIEIDKKYFDIAEKRINEYQGILI